VKPRRWHLWHRDPWGARRHPYTDDERQHQHQHAKMELRFVFLIIAMALVTVKLLAHFGG